MMPAPSASHVFMRRSDGNATGSDSTVERLVRKSRASPKGDPEVPLNLRRSRCILSSIAELSLIGDRSPAPSTGNHQLIA